MSIHIYSTIVTNDFSVSFSSQHGGIAILAIHTFNGKKMLEKKFTMYHKQLQQLTFDITEFPKGDYLLSIQLPEGLFFRKFIKSDQLTS